MKKDYYKILEISDDEKKLKGEPFNKELKKKYRSLCLKWHPDKCPSDDKKKEYEDKIKEINEAYAVLSDEAKRNEYDNPMSGGSFGNVDDFMDWFNGFGFNFTEKKEQRGQTIHITLKTSLEDLFNGVEKRIKYSRKVRCEECNGSGMTSQSKKETCSHCGGTGTILTQNSMWSQRITTCSHCNGKGFIIKNPCNKCGGSGLTTKEEEITVNIPKGSTHGMQLVFNGMGYASPSTNLCGDLVVTIQEIAHEHFSRQGNDLYFILDVPVIDALVGGSVNIRTIDNKTLCTKIKQGTKDGDKVRYANMGMPYMDNTTKRGDMYGIVRLIIPPTLSEEEVETLKTLQNKGSFKYDNNN